MNVLPNAVLSPRLLSTAAADVEQSAPSDRTASRYKLKGSSVFSGNGRAIFIGIAVGALVICGSAYVGTRSHELRGDLVSVRRFFAVRTRSVAPPPPLPSQPQTVTVQISPAMLRVTAISLGHPRIAVINGEQVAEGESLTLTARDSGVSVRLKVTKIADGQLELTDGTRVITSRLGAGGLQKKMLAKK